MSDLEARLATLEAKIEIKELTARYCWHVSRGEGKAVSDLFTDDGVLDGSSSGLGVISGRPALDEFYARAVSEPGTALPYIHNHVIDVQGDEASGSCGLEATFKRESGSVRQTGYYLDRYRRERGRWLFAERKLFFHPTR